MVTARVVHDDDEGSSIATPDGYHISPKLAYLISQNNDTTTQQFFQDAYAGGGVNVETLSIQIVAENNSDQSIRILDISAVSVRRTAPLSGTFFYNPPQGGNADIDMMFNLDSADPTASNIAAWTEADPRPSGPYFNTHTITLTKGGQQVLFVRAETERFYATFDLEIDYIVGGGTGNEKRLIVSDRGQPFRVTGMHYAATPGIVSYQHIFEVNNSDPYALCEAVHPHFFAIDALGSPPCYGSRDG